MIGGTGLAVPPGDMPISTQTTDNVRTANWTCPRLYAEVSATDAARNFSDILDAVEHRGEHFTIVRRGKVIAQLDPVHAGRGAEVKALLQRHLRDPAFAQDVASTRALVEIESRP